MMGEAAVADIDTAKMAQVKAGGSLHKKLATAMGSMKKIEKKGRNEHFKYDFVRETDLVEAVRGFLAEQNVMLYTEVLGTTERELRGKESTSTLTMLDLLFTFADGDTGETWAVKGVGYGSDGQDKGAYKALTGGLKYFLLKTFLVPSDVADPDQSVGEQPAEKGTRRPSTKKPDAPAEKGLAQNYLRKLYAITHGMGWSDFDTHVFAGVASLKTLTVPEATQIIAMAQDKSKGKDRAVADCGVVPAGDPRKGAGEQPAEEAPAEVAQAAAAEPPPLVNLDAPPTDEQWERAKKVFKNENEVRVLVNHMYPEREKNAAITKGELAAAIGQKLS